VQVEGKKPPAAMVLHRPHLLPEVMALPRPREDMVPPRQQGVMALLLQKQEDMVLPHQAQGVMVLRHQKQGVMVPHHQEQAGTVLRHQHQDGRQT
jgi:hypothetical protein